MAEPTLTNKQKGILIGLGIAIPLFGGLFLYYVGWCSWRDWLRAKREREDQREDEELERRQVDLCEMPRTIRPPR